MTQEPSDNGTPTTVFSDDADRVPASRPRSFSNPELVILVITSLGHAVCHLAELIFPAVILSVMAEFALEPQQATRLAMLGYMLMGAGALPVGLWADVSDPWKIHFYYFLAIVVSCIGVTLSNSPLTLFLTLTALGLATSIYHPVGLAMISLGVRKKNLAMGVNGVSGSLGIAAAPLVGLYLSRMGMWRMAYVVVAVLSAISALVMLAAWKYRFVKPDHGPLSAAEEAAAAQPRPRGTIFGFPILLLCVMMMGGFNYRCLATALPSYLSGEPPRKSKLVQPKDTAPQESPNSTPVQAPEKSAEALSWAVYAPSLVMLAGCLGQIFGGKLGDSFGPRWIYLSFICLLSPLGILLGFLGGTSAAIIVACMLSVCLFGQQPVENTLLAEYTSVRRRSVSYGTKFIMTFGIGAIGTQVVGLIWEATGGLNSVFYLIGGSACVMASLLAFWCSRNRPQASSKVEAVTSVGKMEAVPET